MEISKRLVENKTLLALGAAFTLYGSTVFISSTHADEIVDVSVEVVSNSEALCGVNGMDDVFIGTIIAGDTIPALAQPSVTDQFTITCEIESVAGVQVSHNGGLQGTAAYPRLSNGTDFIRYIPKIRVGLAGARQGITTSGTVNMGPIPEGETLFTMSYDLTPSQVIPTATGIYTDSLTFTFTF